jgi:hypothetical protein
MDSLGSLLNPALDLAQRGLEFLQTGFAKVNAWQGLLIALFAVVLMRSWGQWLLVAAISTAVYVLVRHVTPIVMQGAEIKLPDVTAVPFWLDAASFFVGFAIIIAMFFAVKAVFFKAKPKSAKGAH